MPKILGRGGTSTGINPNTGAPYVTNTRRGRRGQQRGSNRNGYIFLTRLDPLHEQVRYPQGVEEVARALQLVAVVFPGKCPSKRVWVKVRESDLDLLLVVQGSLFRFFFRHLLDFSRNTPPLLPSTTLPWGVEHPYLRSRKAKTSACHGSRYMANEPFRFPPPCAARIAGRSKDGTCCTQQKMGGGGECTPLVSGKHWQVLTETFSLQLLPEASQACAQQETCQRDQQKVR